LYFSSLVLCVNPLVLHVYFVSPVISFVGPLFQFAHYVSCVSGIANTVWVRYYSISNHQTNCVVIFININFNFIELSFRPTKANYIRAKYQMLSFVHRLPCRDDDEISTADLSQVREQLFTHFQKVHLNLPFRMCFFLAVLQDRPQLTDTPKIGTFYYEYCPIFQRIVIDLIFILI
jgi:hypothetical protein